MANHRCSPRDRLPSNSPDSIKSSILRESGMGWNSQSSGSLSSSSSGESPLCISKRHSPGRPRGPAVARRSSSSYKHIHDNNVVSKSLFESQIPTLSTPSNRLVPIPITFLTSSPTQQVSAEKRPRPSSLYEQTENKNERPFALKRECRQSKGFQNLIEKDPVTFKLRQPTSSDTRPSSSLIPVPLTRIPLASYAPSAISIQPPASLSAHPPPSPGRSSLVSKRLHGPCLSGGGKREHLKRVGFDERCDVVEFDREEEALEMDDDADDPFFQVLGIWRITAVKNPPPPRHSDIPTDLDSEDGVPFSRSHHIERFR
ncbi:hypothetical protein K443DRAFT_651891 [Laccaria amethystina LaAM-08-1]|uniref:Uncharacterized protein n=1 Tax=Laccaria amethystina LaAM-08-1 TaxID=1095629 RepID=A0A0C9WI09_9AGAR|nr:hypothetical protein K443DRAFT_651891 [Laccaria amethystina LaAM-08-1]